MHAVTTPAQLPMDHHSVAAQSWQAGFPTVETNSHRPARAAFILDRRRIRLLTVVVFSVTVLQRFAVPGTDNIVGIGFLICVGATVLGLGFGTLRLDPTRIVLYSVAIGGLLLTMLMKSTPFSTSSFVLLAVLYFPFVAVIFVNVREYRQGLLIFQSIMSALAVIGLIQFSAQFIIGSDWMFPFDLVLPNELFISQFNLRIPIDGDLNHLKSNGLCFLEPSHFAQFIAVGILVEMLYFRRAVTLALFGAAYLVSFSGTGLLLLTIVVIPLCVLRRQYWILGVIIVGIPLIYLLQDVPPFSMFFSRMDEFSNVRGSGSMRLFGPFWFVNDLMLKDPTALFFGFGPGAIKDITEMVDYDVLASSWLKLLVEYGLVGSVCFLTFWIYVLFANSPDRILSFACLVQFMLLGGYLNSYYVQFLYLALVGWPHLVDPKLADFRLSA
jgi:hypothetical protein